MSSYGKAVLLGIGIAFSILPTIAVILRFHARALSQTGLRIDDWIMIPAVVRGFTWKAII